MMKLVAAVLVIFFALEKNNLGYSFSLIQRGSTTKSPLSDCGTATTATNHHPHRRQHQRRHVSSPPRLDAKQCERLEEEGGDSAATGQIKKTAVVALDGTPKEIESPVLRAVYPAMAEHVREYGHPNIPLGSPEGKQCQTLRRLRVRDKLCESDVNLLTLMGFTWHSLEDVYRTSDFDEMIGRLQKYAEENDGDVSPPKKYAADPELGAWVTGVRRLGPENLVDPSHAERLNAMNYQWQSPRACGSAFMKRYREILAQCEESAEGGGRETVLKDVKVREWIRAQAKAAERGALSETRQHYMTQLAGPEWKTMTDE